MNQCVCFDTPCSICARIESEITRLVAEHRSHHDALEAAARERAWHQPERPSLRHLLREASRELGHAPLDDGEAWIASEHPEVAWLVSLPPPQRSFYRSPPARAKLAEIFDEVPPLIWTLLLDEDAA